MSHTPIGFQIAPSVHIGDGHPLLVMAGPCVVESHQLCLDVAKHMQKVCADLGLGYIFKASFDKANRTSAGSFRGPGMQQGLDVLRAIKQELGLPIVTDVHDTQQIERAAEVVDVLQIPAFLCRQTDLLHAAGATGLTVNVKKGQFMAPGDMARAVDKVRAGGTDRVCLCERGTTFGYHNLVVDMRSLPTMRAAGVPVIFDATHSVQLPGGAGGSSGGERQFVPHLFRAAIAVGVDGVFLETHPSPADALCDGPNSMPLHDMASLLKTGRSIDELLRLRG